MPDSVLPNLHDCLEATSWRRLLALMASHGLPCSTRWRKADLIAALHAHLLNSVTWQRGIPDLGAPARSALETIVQAGGVLPATTFLATFGPLRPHRPWRADEPREAPWRNPASPTERLWYLGLLYLDPPAASPGVVQQVVVPLQLLPILRPLLLAPAADQPIHLLPRPGQPADLAWHVALLLASVEVEPVSPIRNRWLPPTLLAALASRTGLDQAPDYASARSEHRFPYLAFLHLLAEAAGLLAGGARLAITTAGWQWLAAPSAERWSQLWAAWRTAPTELTRSYRFPWAGVGPAGRDLVLDQLRAAPPDQYRPLRQLVEAAHLQDLSGHLAQPWRERADVAAALITGPLFWFGAIDLAQPAAADLPDLPAAHRDRWLADDDLADPVLPWRTGEAPGQGKGTPEPGQSTTASLTAEATVITEVAGAGNHEGAHAAQQPAPVVPSRLVRLNLTGAWLLGQPDCAAPAFPAPAECNRVASDPDLLLVPATATPIHLAHLAPLTEWLPPTPPAMVQPLRLTAARVGQVVANGFSLPQLFDYLIQALGQPPSRRQAQRLRHWAAAGQQVRIRRITVLETAEAALMGQLRSRKLLRRHLGDAISPTRSVLDPAAGRAVVQHLATLGIYAGGWPELEAAVAKTAPTQEDNVAAQGSTDASTALAPAFGGQLLLAGLVYRGLAEHLSLPVPVSASLLDDLADQLDPRHRAAAEHAAEQALAALDATLRGYLGLPAWQADRQAADILPGIEQALAQGQDLRLTYWSAAREQPTVRRVTPYWIERRQAVPYLIGYCHLREAERIFRIDRIVECQPLARPAAAPQSHDD